MISYNPMNRFHWVVMVRGIVTGIPLSPCFNLNSNAERICQDTFWDATYLEGCWY